PIFEGINRKSAIFDTQKLEWMNGRYMANADSAQLAVMLRERFTSADRHSDDWWRDLAELLKVRARTIEEMAQQARPYVEDELVYDDAAVEKHWKEDRKSVV